MASVMEIVISAVDKASSVIDNISDSGEKAAKGFNVNWGAAGVATAAAGAAIDGLAQSQAPLTKLTKELSSALDISNEEVRDLALASSNVTFPMNEVLELFDMAQKKGLKSGEAIQEYAGFWDMVGDAIGGNSRTLAESGTALQALGIDAEHSSDALAAFGYVDTLTIGVQGFLDQVKKLSPELETMNLSVDNTAALFGIMEDEMGLVGSVASKELKKAINSSDGDFDIMLENLGISNEKFAEYTAAVKDSSGAIEDHAKIHEESFTPLQKLKHATEELKYEFGDEIDMLSSFSGILTGVGTAMTIVSTIKGLFTTATAASTVATTASTAASTAATVATTGLGVSMGAALLPILAIVAAIAAVIAIGVLLVKNWDTISAFGKKVFAGLGDGIKACINAIIDLLNFFIQGLNKISFDIPDWVPLIGGKKFGFNLSLIQRLHTGGTFRADTAGGEGLAMLRDGERVLTPEMYAAYSTGGGGYGTANIYIQLDGKTLASVIGQKLVDTIRIKTGVKR